jgi:hypothetical protein
MSTFAGPTATAYVADSNEVANSDDDSTTTSTASDEGDIGANGANAESAASNESITLDRELLTRLLHANIRLPRRESRSNADLWLQSIVDHEMAAGVSLVGVGDLEPDGVSDLVWRDAAGQLFVSDGATLLQDEGQNDGLAAPLEEALRLHPNEVFVALADFGRDGVGDWLIEDSLTGDVWIVDGASREMTFAGPEGVAGVARLLAHGDFDGDGRAQQLLWQQTDGSLAWTHLEGSVPIFDGSSDPFAGNEGSEVYAVADLDGDGRDDLIARRTDGQLEYGLSGAPSANFSATGAGELSFEWVAGPDFQNEGLDLLGILDLEQDGGAEIAWLRGQSLEIWDAMTGPRP